MNLLENVLIDHDIHHCDVVQYDNFFDKEDFQEIQNKTDMDLLALSYIMGKIIQSINIAHHSGRLILLRYIL